jgi:hypothetical protein
LPTSGHRQFAGCVLSASRRFPHGPAEWPRRRGRGAWFRALALFRHSASQRVATECPACSATYVRRRPSHRSSETNEPRRRYGRRSPVTPASIAAGRQMRRRQFAQSSRVHGPQEGIISSL